MHKSLEKVVQMKRDLDPPPLSAVPNVTATPMLEKFIQRALAREPHDRFRSAREMLEQWYLASATLENITGIDGMEVDYEDESSESAARTIPRDPAANDHVDDLKTLSDLIAAKPISAPPQLSSLSHPQFNSSSPPPSITLVDDTLPTDSGQETTIRPPTPPFSDDLQDTPRKDE